MANGNSYLGLASRAEELNVGENFQAGLDASARARFTTSNYYDTTTTACSVLGYYYASNIVLEESMMQVSFGLTTRKRMYSVLSALTLRHMPPAARSRQCSRDSAWVGEFARSAMS